MVLFEFAPNEIVCESLRYVESDGAALNGVCNSDAVIRSSLSDALSYRRCALAPIEASIW